MSGTSGGSDASSVSDEVAEGKCFTSVAQHFLTMCSYKTVTHNNRSIVKKRRDRLDYNFSVALCVTVDTKLQIMSCESMGLLFPLNS